MLLSAIRRTPKIPASSQKAILASAIYDLRAQEPGLKLATRSLDPPSSPYLPAGSLSFLFVASLWLGRLNPLLQIPEACSEEGERSEQAGRVWEQPEHCTLAPQRHVGSPADFPGQASPSGIESI